ncbi:MAG: glycosyltransferase [Bacteroidales bacterium]|nr:glycosyltransferase [Bacteroidales bacterium]
MNTIHILFIVSLSFGILYFTVVLKLWYAWKNIPVHTELPDNNHTKVSVIVAARDEENTLPDLMIDILNQTYPNHLFDVILVDDHSKKKISNLSFFKTTGTKNLRILELPEETIGKKKALHFGALRSNAELLLFTDADCRLSPEWIQSHVTKYTKDRSDLIIGLVDYLTYAGVIEKFFRLDLISLVVAGAGSAFAGRPTLCNGANLAVKKDVYMQLADHILPNVPSGDDIFLLHQIKKNSTKPVSVLKSKQGIVKTRTPENILEFFNQRIRWASKSKLYSDPDTIVLSLLIFIANIVMAISLVLCLVSFGKLWYFLSLIILKTTGDIFVVGSGLKYFGKIKHLLWLPLFELFYPFYILVAAAGGIFNAYSWKPITKNK